MPGGDLGVCQRVLEVHQRVSELGMQPKGFIKTGNMRERSLIGRRGWVLDYWCDRQESELCLPV